MADREFHKLVRDRIPEIIERDGKNAITKRLSESEYVFELNRKLLEEAQEYCEDGTLEELADVWEVVLALLKTKGWCMEQLEEIRLRKWNERGGFDEKIFLEWVKEN